MRRLTMLVVALGFVMVFGTGGYAQTPSGSGDKMDKRRGQPRRSRELVTR
jgi:hypothetical protein